MSLPEYTNPIPSLSNVSDYRIGTLLIEMGKISVDDAQRIVHMHKEQGLRFGDAAKRLGLITEKDIQEVLSKQFNYPYVLEEHLFSDELVAAYQPFSPQVEVLRRVRSKLMLGWFKEKHKAAAITSIESASGNSRLAANLAVVFAQLGEKTLLIDANLRKPTQHQIFNLSNERGLSDMLIGRAGIEAITHIIPFDKLSVLSAGTLPPNPQEIVSGTRFRELVDFLRSIYDVVLIDTPAHSVGADAQNIAAVAGGAILVARKHKTKASEMTEAAEQLTVDQTSVIGTLLIDF